MNAYRRFAAFALAATLSGCAGLPNLGNLSSLKEPKISLAGLALKDMNFMEPTFLVKLKVDNPNDLNLSLDGADAALALNGQKIATGISRSPLTLNSHGTSNLNLEVKANALRAVQQIMQLGSGQPVNYGISGNLNILNWLGGLGKIPFNLKGSVDKDTLLRGAELLGK